MKNSTPLFVVAFAISILPACQTLGKPQGSAGCPTFSDAVVLGEIALEEINEASGIVASQRNPGVYYLNNDSGDTARIFAIDERGNDLGIYDLNGIKGPKGVAAIVAVDFEDIAVGPARDLPGTFIYVADIGDNGHQRDEVVIYRVPEPEIPAGRKAGRRTLSGVAALRLQYPDGAAHNAEALLIDPQNADLYIVTKTGKSPAAVFRYPAPHRPDELVVLEEVALLQLGKTHVPLSGLVTGGDISLSRNQILLRTYSHVLLWQRAPGQSIARAISGLPCLLPQRDEPQGEAIGWKLDESGYITVSERTHQPIYFFARPPH